MNMPAETASQGLRQAELERAPLGPMAWTKRLTLLLLILFHHPSFSRHRPAGRMTAAVLLLGLLSLAPSGRQIHILNGIRVTANVDTR